MANKRINGFSNYEITDDGEIISYAKDKNGLTIKQQINKNGYNTVKISDDNQKTHGLYIHRLVAEYFDPNFSKNKTVNHKDGNKQNNNIANLESVTYSENLKHSYDVLSRPVNKSTGFKKVNIYKNGSFIKTSKTIAEASRLSGVSETQIRRLIENCKPSRDGFEFCYF